MREYDESLRQSCWKFNATVVKLVATKFGEIVKYI